MLGVVTLRGEGQYLQRPAHQGRGHVGVHVRALGVCGLHLRQQLAHLHVVLGGGGIGTLSDYGIYIE